MARLTTAHRIDLRSIVESIDGREMALYLISRLIDERDQNKVHDHWHPEIATPFGEMAKAWIQALKEAGVTFEYQPARVRVAGTDTSK